MEEQIRHHKAWNLLLLAVVDKKISNHLVEVSIKFLDQYHLQNICWFCVSFASQLGLLKTTNAVIWSSLEMPGNHITYT